MLKWDEIMMDKKSKPLNIRRHARKVKYNDNCGQLVQSVRDRDRDDPCRKSPWLQTDLVRMVFRRSECLREKLAAKTVF